MTAIVGSRYLLSSGGFAFATRVRHPGLYRGLEAQMRREIGWSLASGMTSNNTTYMQPRNTWNACSEASGKKGASDTWICYPTQETSTCLNY